MMGYCSKFVLLAGVMFLEIFAETRPNIVFILADDLGWNDVGFTGRSDLQTPNIDALAYNGRILTQHYALPTCTPSRAALLTGKYPIRTGLQGFPILPGVPHALSLEHRLLPQHLKKLGYKTHLVGKWHLGYHQWKYTPTSRGFDSHFGYFNGYISYFDHYMTNFKLNQSGHDFWRDKSPQQVLQGQYVTDLLTEEAVRLIHEAPGKVPFFMLLSHLAPHAGNLENKLEYLPQDIERFSYIPDEDRRQYADDHPQSVISTAMVWGLDRSVGQIVEALADTGLLNDTIIVFASDNGAQSVSRFSNGGSNYPMRGTKLTVFESGVRTVAAIWSPLISTTHKLGVFSNMFHMSDWLPTLYQAAGGDLSSLSGLDGRSQWSSLRSEVSTAVRTEMLLNIDEKTGQRAVRHNNWKLLTESGFYFEGNRNDEFYGDFTNVNYTYGVDEVLSSQVTRALRLRDFRTTNASEALAKRDAVTITCQMGLQSVPCVSDESPCLFDLLLDPCERSNLATARPDMVALLLAKLETYGTMLTPQLKLDADPLANPILHNNTWLPWIEESLEDTLCHC